MRHRDGPRWQRLLVAPVTGLLVGAMLTVGGQAADAAPAPHPAPKAPKTPAVRGVRPVTASFTKAKPQPPAYAPAHTAWPSATSVTLPLSSARRTATGSPVWARAATAKAPGSLRVRVLDRAAATRAGIDGVLLSVTADRAGPAEVGVDYRDFAQAYGGNYGSRLRLAAYPDCLLTTPQVASCRVAQPLTSTNDVAGQTVSAPVTMAGRAMVLAAAAAPTGGEEGGAGGTFAATTLKPSGSWSAGGSTGDFTYSYPLAIPPAPSDLAPQTALVYDSATTDGQTSATQAQASWLGEGWNTPESYIEQSFQNCSESPEGSAAPVKIYDMCYDGPIFTMSLNGSSTSLVWDKTKKVFRSENADGTVIRHFCTKTSDETCTAGTGNGTDAYAQDWWQVTERNGTTYSFGMNRLPGWASGKPVTNSVATEPVYSAHSGDPCYDSNGLSSSVCTTAYRWGVDYVADAHGDAMSYYYKQDTNYYGKYNGASNVSYVRDMHLDHIDYGFTDGNAFGTAPDRIQFVAVDRCVTSGCGPLNATNAPKWPDVPYDLVCASGATCAHHGPSYFSTVRLSGVQAQQYSLSAAKYTTVDSYAFTQSTPATGDGTAATLWLSQIAHTGSDLVAGSSTAITTPALTFTPIQLENRVDTTHDGLPAFYKYRIATITTESGSQINVTYELPDPCTAPVKITAAANTSSCYPVSWTPEGYTAPITDWFNKWAVTRVVQTDPTGGASAQATNYQYKGGAAWHYDDDETVKPKYRMYGQFRGYGDVVTLLGDGVNDRQSKTEATFYRGMSKNNNSTVVNVNDSQNGVHEDVDQLSGESLETSAYLGDVVDHSTINSYWVSAAAATRTRTGLPALTSTWVAPVETFTRQALTSTGSTTWRYKETDTAYDASPDDANFGLPVRIYTHTSPAGAPYDTCTGTSYAAANTTKNIVGLVSETETVSVACGGYTAGSKPSAPGSLNTLTAPATVSRPAQTMSATRIYYDDPKFDTTFPQAAAPSKGDVTMTRKASDYSAGAYTWQTQTRSKFDSAGRATDSYDANGNLSTAAYTSNSLGLLTGQSVTNPLGQKVSWTVDPQRGSTLTSTDANSVVSSAKYDALGRTTAVWQSSRDPDTTPANSLYTYVIANDGVSSVTTKALNDESGYTTSTVLYDAMLRPRQVQGMTPQGGRLIDDTFYDSRGWTSAKYNGWWDSATTPNTTIVSAADLHAQVPSADAYTYNSLGAAVIDQNLKNGVEVSRGTTVANGDRTTVIPPAGGAVSSTLVDPLGRTSEIDSYVTAPTLTSPADPFTGTYRISGGTPRVVTYGYDGHGNKNSTTQGAAGSGGPAWTTTYNLFGQVTSQTDPDAGTTTGMTYDGDGNLLQSTDPRGKTVSYSYDALSRMTGSFDSTVAGQTPGPAGNQLASWVYDNANGVAGLTHAIGHATTTTAYSGGAAYSTQQLNFNVFGESMGVTMTIPDTEKALGGAYTVRHQYSSTIGLLLKDGYNAQGGLPSETVNHTYQGVLDLPDTLGGLIGYDQGTTYNAYGQVEQQKIGSGTNLAYITDTYDPNSGRLTDQLITRSTGTANYVDEQAFGYDQAGNITKLTDTRNGTSATSETQCFDYDGLAQLTQAWTATDNCAAKPSSTNSSMVGDGLGASSAYWTSWGLDALGDRTSQVEHGLTGGAATDVTTAYGYGSNGQQPHTLTSTTTTGGRTGSTSYQYDTAGSMTKRNAGQGNQALAYNDAGQLTAVTGSAAGSSSFVYDVDGRLLLQKDPASTTFYLENQQFTLTAATGVVTGVRYYELPGGGDVVRTGTATTAFSYSIGDQNGTPTLYLDNTAQTPTWRQYTPYGGDRGAAVGAPDNRGFLQKPTDAATGLTIIGARQYDPSVGRFITVDPQLEDADVTQLNGYGYAGNSPVSHADPSGQAGDWCATLACAQQTGGGQWCTDCASGATENSDTHFKPLTKHITISTQNRHYNTYKKAWNKWVKKEGGSAPRDPVEEAVWELQGFAYACGEMGPEKCEVDTDLMQSIAMGIIESKGKKYSNWIIVIGGTTRDPLHLEPDGLYDPTLYMPLGNGGDEAVGATSAQGTADFVTALAQSVDWNKSHPDGGSGGGGPDVPFGPQLEYKSNPKHDRGVLGSKVGPQPTNPQKFLPGSFNVGSGNESYRRIAYDPVAKEIIVYARTENATYHGYVVTWGQLQNNETALFMKMKIFRKGGKPIQKE